MAKRHRDALNLVDGDHTPMQIIAMLHAAALESNEEQAAVRGAPRRYSLAIMDDPAVRVMVAQLAWLVGVDGGRPFSWDDCLAACRREPQPARSFGFGKTLKRMEAV
jgi:hypothetical protein